MRDVKRRGTCTLLERGSYVFHELVEVEVDTNGALQYLQRILLEEKIMVLSLRNLGLTTCTRCNRQSLDSLNYQVPWEIAADQADHLMVVEGCDDFVMRGRVENFLNLLKEGFSVELSCGNERVLPQ